MTTTFFIQAGELRGTRGELLGLNSRPNLATQVTLEASGGLLGFGENPSRSVYLAGFGTIRPQRARREKLSNASLRSLWLSVRTRSDRWRKWLEVKGAIDGDTVKVTCRGTPRGTLPPVREAGAVSVSEKTTLTEVTNAKKS
jgi:hypothetical protein